MFLREKVTTGLQVGLHEGDLRLANGLAGHHPVDQLGRGPVVVFEQLDVIDVGDSATIGTAQMGGGTVRAAEAHAEQLDLALVVGVERFTSDFSVIQLEENRDARTAVIHEPRQREASQAQAAAPDSAE
jgi:hypothetical protein